MVGKAMKFLSLCFIIALGLLVATAPSAQDVNWGAKSALLELGMTEQQVVNKVGQAPNKVDMEVAPEVLSRAQAYGAGLTRYRARDFAGAAEKFARVADEDPPSALFLERARQLAQQPPGADWEAVSAQEEK
jgi:hypothetical protein